jgi:hypothetical protein
MKEMKLFNRLVVHIREQKTDGKIGSSASSEPKAHSKGWVGCFNEQAAREIVELLTGFGPTQPLFSVTNNRTLYKYWQQDGIQGITLKDLRRASLYWLGHHSNFSKEPIKLMKHARHKRIDTTMLYLRRPEESLEGNLVLDLDA